MRTHSKIMVLLAVTIAMFGSVFLGYQYIKDRQEALFIKANSDTKELMIDNILNSKAKSFQGSVHDYACWDEMVEYVAHPSRKWEAVNLSTIESFGFSNTWLLNSKFENVYTICDTSRSWNSSVVSKEILSQAFEGKGYCHFFLNLRDTLWEFTGATIVPSTDYEHKSPAQGYFIVAKFWNKEYIQSIEGELDFAIRFRSPADSLQVGKRDNSKITISETFKDAYGKDVLSVEFTSKNQLMADLSVTNRLSYALIGLLLVTILVFFYAVRRWISTPLAQITKSLSNESAYFVNGMEKQKNEFGEIAGLIKNFFEQKNRLQKEIEERIEAEERAHELYENTVNLNHELQASEEELRQNLDMTMQLNEVLSKQQQEITDSINYASRIQAALLTPIELLKHLNHDFFILYKPRNIVSGDFYWVSTKDNKLYIAVADCTGHGVPGGFMSMLGMAFLTEIVNQSQDQRAGEILDTLRLRVASSLHQTGKVGDSRDGMDIGLCIIDVETLAMQFAGAYNPLYVVRKVPTTDGTKQVEFIEHRGDRMPICFSHKIDQQFTTIDLQLQKNDMLYLLTDGYQDQVSSITLEKFKRNRIRELLNELVAKPLVEQKEILDYTFEEYRGEYRQVDDVLVFGMRI